MKRTLMVSLLLLVMLTPVFAGLNGIEEQLVNNQQLLAITITNNDGIITLDTMITIQGTYQEPKLKYDTFVTVQSFRKEEIYKTTILLGEEKTDFIIPYFSNAKTLIVTKDDQEILRVDLSSRAICNEDFICNSDMETSRNCPNDCFINWDDVRCDSKGTNCEGDNATINYEYNEIALRKLYLETVLNTENLYDHQKIIIETELSILNNALNLQKTYSEISPLTLVLIIVGLVASILIFVITKRRRLLSQEKTIPEQKELQKTNTPQLTNYVESMLKKGYSQQQIQNKLLEKGWAIQQIKTAFLHEEYLKVLKENND